MNSITRLAPAPSRRTSRCTKPSVVRTRQGRSPHAQARGRHRLLHDHPKGYVPLLELDDGTAVRVAVIVQYIADRKPARSRPPLVLWNVIV